MSFVANLPQLKVYVRKDYLTQKSEDSSEFVEAYLVSVKSLMARPLLFTVYTEHGAVYSGLPINALSTSNAINQEFTLEQAQPFSCISPTISVIKYDFTKDMDVLVRINGELVLGQYLFTVEYGEGGLGEDPEQFKTHNVISLYDGCLVAFPNNMLLFQDGFFAGKNDEFPKYMRNSRYYKGPA